MQLITYVDRLARDLPGLKSLLDNQFKGLFDGVHLLPFFDPIDAADAGFDPIDHASVDSRLGDWNDVKAISKTHGIMADLIVNHMSADSAQFQDVLQHGEASEYWSLFLKKDDVFQPAPSEVQLKQIYRPRPTSPFSKKRLANGSEVEFWTTFSEGQIDINVQRPEGQQYLENILRTFSEAGITEVRLDAAGYAIKRAGTRCFMLPETFEFLQELDQRCRHLGMRTLVEIHSHYKTQIEIAEKVSRVYDFALPPLLLHALYEGDAKPLNNWLKISPRNCVTVLDTHDGIGILDVAKDNDQPGLLNDQQIDELVDTIHRNSGGESLKASGESASNLDIYQVNCTYFDALGGDKVDYLIARTIQFFAPGTPQIYYVGLLGGRNDIELLESTGVGRDINRHYYSQTEIQSALTSDLAADLFALIELRNSNKAFSGAFSVRCSSRETMIIERVNGGSTATLRVDFSKKIADIELADNGSVDNYQIAGDGLKKLSSAMAN